MGQPVAEAATTALVALFEAHSTAADGRIRVEDLLSGAAAATGEACIAAAGEFDPGQHACMPGAVVMSDRMNAILSNDSTDWSGVGESLFGIIRAGALAGRYSADEFPALGDIYRTFASGVGCGTGGDSLGWGFVPLSVPAENRPRIQPLRSAYELRTPVRALFAAHTVPVEEWPAACARALASELARVQAAIDHRVAVTLVLETVNGMAKTAPMTDEAMRGATQPEPNAGH